MYSFTVVHPFTHSFNKDLPGAVDEAHTELGAVDSQSEWVAGVKQITMN